MVWRFQRQQRRAPFLYIRHEFCQHDAVEVQLLVLAVLTIPVLEEFEAHEGEYCANRPCAQSGGRKVLAGDVLSISCCHFGLIFFLISARTSSTVLRCFSSSFRYCSDIDCTQVNFDENCKGIYTNHFEFPRPFLVFPLFHACLLDISQLYACLLGLFGCNIHKCHTAFDGRPANRR